MERRDRASKGGREGREKCGMGREREGERERRRRRGRERERKIDRP